MIIDFIFSICVIFLELLGKITGLTYKEISVVFNLWIQGGLLVLSSIVPFYLAIRNGMIVMSILTGILVLIYTLGFIGMLLHYRGSMNHAFDLCAWDLENLANRFHTTYGMVNILIFIMGWLMAVGINLLLTWILW